MHNSDLIPPHHLACKAVMDLRPSTPHQVVSPQASLRVQYALGARAHQLGGPTRPAISWMTIWGLPAATAHQRPGCKTLVAHVTLAQVGRIVPRMAPAWRVTGRTGIRGLDLCGSKGCVMADSDGHGCPRHRQRPPPVGLEGHAVAWERPTMQARLTAGLIPKAARGRVGLPTAHGLGPQRTGQSGTRCPTRKPTPVCRLVGATFLPCRSARPVVAVFNTHDLLLPAVTASALSCGRRRVWPPGSPFSSSQPRQGVHLWPQPHAATCGDAGPPLQAPGCPRSRGASASRTSTHFHPVGDISPRCRPCSKTITPRMTGTQPVGSRALAQPFLHGLVSGGACGPRWSCRRRGAPATSAPPSANSLGPLCVTILRPIRSIPGSGRRFSRPLRPWNSMAMPSTGQAAAAGRAPRNRPRAAARAAAL